MPRKTIQIPIDVPYHTLGNFSEKIKYVWIACHGYGQLSEYFIKHFECLDLNEHFVIAPQGLSRFYLREFTGRVGATWMTNYDRDLEIGNYLRVIETIYHTETKGHAGFSTILMGFSQGAATIGRYASLTDAPFDALLLWGGRCPHDVEGRVAKRRIGDKPFAMYIGNRDKYLDEKQVSDQKAVLDEMGLSPEIHIFDGEHKMYPAPLKRFVASLTPQLK